MRKQKIYQIIEDYFSNKPVKRVLLFGSFSRNEENNNSDIDLILNLDHPIGLFAIGRYIADLEKLTNRKIDIGTQNSLTPEFLNTIKDDLKIVYEG